MTQQEDFDDATIVAAHAAHAAHADHADHADHVPDDATIAVNHSADYPAAHEPEDATIAVGRAPVEDATVVANNTAANTTVVNAGMHGEVIATSMSSSSQAMPVPEPKGDIGRVLPNRGEGGLDPLRPIVPAPGMKPWESAPQGKRGVMQGLPVSYGARQSTETLRPIGLDEVQRQIGPAPLGHAVPVRAEREALPSLERRDRRGRVITLAVYGAVVVVSVLGLWGVAAIAFG